MEDLIKRLYEDGSINIDEMYKLIELNNKSNIFDSIIYRNQFPNHLNIDYNQQPLPPPYHSYNSNTAPYTSTSSDSLNINFTEK